MSVESPKRSVRARHARSTSASISAGSLRPPRRSASSGGINGGIRETYARPPTALRGGLRALPVAAEHLGEALAPVPQARLEAELGPRLGIRVAPQLRAHEYEVAADQQAHQPRGEVARLARAEQPRELGHPLALRHGLVVGDVVDPGLAVVE